MPTPQPKYRIALEKNSGTWYTVSGGIVSEVSSLSFLMFDDIDMRFFTPEGWRKSELALERNPKLHGVYRAYSTPFGFVKNAATILRHVFHTQGTEGRCTLVRYKRDPFTLLYAEDYRGPIDFSAYDSKGGRVTVNILEGGLPAQLKAQSGVDREISLQAPHADMVSVGGVDLVNLYEWEQSEALGNTQTHTRTSSAQNSQIWSPTLKKTTTENTSELESKLLSKDQPTGVFNGTNDPWGNMDHAFSLDHIQLPLELQYEINATVSADPGNVNQLQFEPVLLTGNDSGYTRLFAVGNEMGVAAGQTQTFNISGAVSANIGDINNLITYRFGFWEAGFSPSTAGTIQIHRVVFKVVYRTTSSTTNIQAASLHGVAESLAAPIVSTQGGSFQSSFLASTNQANGWGSQPGNTRLTSGEGLRRISGAKLITNLDKYFDSLRGIWPVGLGAEGNTITLERLDYYYRKNQFVAHLGEIDSDALEVVPLTRDMFNKLSIGFPESDRESTNGRDSISTRHQYEAKGIRTPDTLELTASFVADMYEIEEVRQKDSTKGQTNTSEDKRIYLLETEGAKVNGAYPLNRAGTVTGILAGNTTYNRFSTPKHNLLRNGGYLSSLLHLRPGSLEYRSSNKNRTAVINDGVSGAVALTADVPISSLLPAYYKPLLFNFRTVVDINLFGVVAAAPYGYLTFKWRGNTHKGFVQKISTTGAAEEAYQCSLIAHPETDLTKLTF